MTQLRIKNRIDHVQMSILLGLFKSWNLETEIMEEDQPMTPNFKKIPATLSQARGMWADYDIDVKRNRKQTREKRTKIVSE